MLPLILTNAFRRPRGTRTSVGVSVCEKTNVYACVEEMVGVICDELGGSPLLLPTRFDEDTVRALLQKVDGIFLPGAVSNVHPSLYGSAIEAHPQTFDSEHDKTDLFLIRCAQEMGIPFLGVCRAMQTMNVAFGGTLKQKIAESAVDHYCSGPCDGHDDAPRFMHHAQIEAGGLFASVFEERRIQINSLHEQSIDQVGDGLFVEARASDGVIEALSCPSATSFFVGVQWHPEAMPCHAVSQTLFTAFKKAIAKKKEQHT